MTCNHTGKSEVIDTRHTAKGIRRRKLCLECMDRYTTLETVIDGPKPRIAASPAVKQQVGMWGGLLG